ncbi:hypothetical protein, partial [Chromobacterium haemolyticum]|uniref:hypothetical protein n=1 Tax=Chromobacterium haemolyticum TaxID=394935 RepID=UPI00244C6B63
MSAPSKPHGLLIMLLALALLLLLLGIPLWLYRDTWIGADAAADGSRPILWPLLSLAAAGLLAYGLFRLLKKQGLLTGLERVLRWGAPPPRLPDADAPAPFAPWAGLERLVQAWRQRPAQQRPHWLLLCGAPEAVHQAVPALAKQPWLETDGMVLIDASAAPPPGGWRRLRGRWQAPADAVIALLPQAADAAALAERAEQWSIASGWTLPITLCQRAPDNAGPGIAGWLLPVLPANADGWADQARSWAMRLPLRGIPTRQDSMAQPFLLRCSQWLEREAHTLAEAWQRWRGGLTAPSA